MMHVSGLIRRFSHTPFIRLLAPAHMSQSGSRHCLQRKGYSDAQSQDLKAFQEKIEEIQHSPMDPIPIEMEKIEEYQIQIVRHTPVPKRTSSKLPEVVTPIEDESTEISGVPQEHVIMRRVRIFKPAREAPQSGWNNTKLWKIEMDSKERWENPMMGWSANSDPLSNITMNLDFASAKDAVRFCKKNRWQYEIIEPTERKVAPKAYSSNFSWNKRTRVATK